MNIDEAIENLNQAVRWLEEALTPREERWAVASKPGSWWGPDPSFIAADKDGIVWMSKDFSEMSMVKFMSKDEAVVLARVLGHRAVRVDRNFTIVDEVCD